MIFLVIIFVTLIVLFTLFVWIASTLLKAAQSVSEKSHTEKIAKFEDNAKPCRSSIGLYCGFFRRIDRIVIIAVGSIVKIIPIAIIVDHQKNS